MTQAFNLSQFANKVNTSGQASLTTAVTGTLPQSNGGTGVTTASNGQLLIGNGSGFTAATLTQGSGITITNASGSITIAASGGGVTSLNGQTGAITNTDYGSIGSYVVASENDFSASQERLPNVTVAGSTLYRTTSGSNSSLACGLNFIQSNTGIASAVSTSLSLSGTWRRLTRSINNSGGTIFSGSNLYVRVS